MVLTAACGAYQFPSGTTAQTGHLSGKVLVTPCAPVEQADQPGKGIYGTGLQIVFTNGSDLTSTAVGGDGKYSIDLAAGTWKVSFKGIARILSGPTTVTVPAGRLGGRRLRRRPQVSARRGRRTPPPEGCDSGHQVDQAVGHEDSP